MSVLIQEPITKEKIKSFKWGKLSLTWYQAAFGAVLVLAAILNLIMLNPNAFSNEYYAAAVRSMLTSWHSFFFNSFDPAGFVTIDKPPVFLWLETISAWLFGFNGISIVLPSVLAGIGSVALLHYMIKREFGPIAGLVAAFSLAITPIAVIMNRHNNPESMLIFFMLLGAWAISRAADNGKFAWLILSVALIGVAFNIKMLEAFIVLPTFYLLYLVFAHVKWWKCFVYLAAATVVLVAISLSWAVVVDLTPASQRPFIGSSSNNTVTDLILGYNGLNRIDRSGFGGNGNFPGGFSQNGNNGQPGGFPPNNTNQQNNNGQSRGGFSQNGGSNNQRNNNGQQGGFRGGFGGGGMNGVIAGQAGPFRMFDQSLTGEAGWLLPLALLGMVLAAIQYWRRFRDDKKQRAQRYKGLLLWSGWLLTFMVVFSMAGGTFHSYYLVLLAPGVAALAGISVETFWHSYQRGGWQKWLLPIALIVNAIFEFNILSAYSDWNRTLGLVMFFVELICAAALVALPRLTQPTNSKWTARIAATSVLGLCIAPAAWAISDIINKPYTNETLPTAVPVGANLSNSAGFFSTSRNGNGLFNNLLNHWNNELTLLIVGLIAVIILAVAVRLFVRQMKKRRTFERIVAGLAAILVICLGGSMALNSLPTATAATLNNAQAISTGIIGNPQDMLSDATISKLISYLETNRGGTTYMLATTSSNNAAPLIIKTGQAVMSLGGFQGSDKVLTADQFAQLVKNKAVRYVLLDIGGSFGPMGGGTQSVTSWVQQTCKVVDSQLWSTSTTTGSNNNSNFGRAGGGFGRNSQTALYNCGA